MKYDVNTIDKSCKLYGYEARYLNHGSGIEQILITKIHYDDEQKELGNYFKPDIVVDFHYIGDDDFNLIIDRFKICFEGYGALEIDKENEVCENIHKAKKLVDNLNQYVNECNKL